MIHLDAKACRQMMLVTLFKMLVQYFCWSSILSVSGFQVVLQKSADHRSTCVKHWFERMRAESLVYLSHPEFVEGTWVAPKIRVPSWYPDILGAVV